MKKQLLAIANWKMYQTQENVESFVEGFVYNNEAVQVILAPSFIHLPFTSWKIPANAALASQNIAAEELGAYTGEVGAQQLADYNIEFAIIGHSERRGLYGETDEIIAKKLKLAQKYNITPILCVGETEAQKAAGKSTVVVLEQLAAAFGNEAAFVADTIIAYEPVWAIGTGKTPTVEEIKMVVDAIRDVYGVETRIVYGGSVSAENVQVIISETSCDGVLIGKASTTAESLRTICEQLQYVVA